MSNLINVVVRDAESPVIPDTDGGPSHSPDTGRFTTTVEQTASIKEDNTNSLVFPLMAAGCIFLVAAVMLILGFRKSRKAKASLGTEKLSLGAVETNLKKAGRIGYFGIVIALAFGGTSLLVGTITNYIETNATTYGANVLDIETADTTIYVTKDEDNDTTYATAATTITLAEPAPMGFDLYIYAPDGNTLSSTDSASVILPVETDDSPLTANTWGLAMGGSEEDIAPESSIWKIVGEEADPLIIGFDNVAVVGSTITLNYGVLVDNSIEVGTYTTSLEYEARSRSYTVVFDANGGTITERERSVLIGDPVGVLPTPVKDGYDFVGWYTLAEGGDMIDENTVPTANTRYYAHYNRIEYSITFNLNGGNIGGDSSSIVKTVYAGDSLGNTIPTTNPAKDYFTFTGWYTLAEGGDIITSSTIPTGPTTYFAQYSQNTIGITFDPNGGTIATVDATRTIDAGGMIGTLPEPSRDHYTFLGWFTLAEGGDTIGSTTIPGPESDSYTYYAHWQRKQYNITYDLAGGNISGSTINPTAIIDGGESLGNTVPANPTKTNYTFVGWYTLAEGGDEVDGSTVPTADARYYAHYARDQYAVTFDLMGGNISGSTINPTVTIDAGDALGSNIPADPEKEEYEFTGWFTLAEGGDEVDGDTVPTINNTTYYARWVEAIVPCNPNATTIGTGNDTDAVCMQDIADMSDTVMASAINGMTAETNYTLRDSRDDQNYTIAKLRDGNIWMTKNMNLPGETKLYSDDSDVPSGYDKGEGASDNPYYILPASSTEGFSDDSVAYVYNSNSENCGNDSPCYSYYSWLATTVGNRNTSSTTVYNSPYSICPAGWRLPVATTSNASATQNSNWKTGDFYALATAYGANLNNFNYDESSATGGNFSANIGPNTAASAPKFLFGGRYFKSSFGYGGSSGLYWSATTNSNVAYYFSFSSSRVDSASGNTHKCGFSVRCMREMPSYVVTYNLNGGNVGGSTSPVTAKVNLGSALGESMPSNVVKTGFVFDGWYTELNGGTEVTSATVPTGDVTYYAHWVVDCNPSATTIGTGNNTDALCLQDVASMSNATLISAVNGMAAETNYTLKDSRDGQDYTVAKLRDGKVWMTTNLNLAGGTKLYSDDSDVAAANTKASGTPYYTLPASSSEGFNNNNVAYVYNTGNMTSTCTTPGCYSYYSWLAATAGGKDSSGTSVTGNGYNAAYSMCPAGWRLPTATTSNASVTSGTNWKTGDSYALATAYGVDLESDYYQSSDVFYNNAGPSTAVPKFLLNGGYINSTLYDGNSNGLYWTVTSNSDSFAYFLSLSSSIASVGFANSRGTGYSVRCMLHEPDLTVTYNLNGGNISGSTTNPTGTVKMGGKIAASIPATEPERSGYAFDGWYTELDGGVKVTGDYVISNDTTLYAKWRWDAAYMQDFARYSSDKKTAVVNAMVTGTSYTLEDERDSKEYTVVKMDDGTVWMTKNLDLAGGTGLYSDTSNVASGYPSSGSTAYYTLPSSSTSGFDSDTAAFVYNSGSGNCGNNSPCYSYYSFRAAAAGSNQSSGVVEYDICPAGWKLPTVSDFQTLTSGKTGNDLVTGSWNGVYSGLYSNGSFMNGGTDGAYWASTVGGSSEAQRLYYTANSVYVRNYYKRYGYAVRCVLK